MSYADGKNKSLCIECHKLLPASSACSEDKPAKPQCFGYFHHCLHLVIIHSMTSPDMNNFLASHTCIFFKHKPVGIS